MPPTELERMASDGSVEEQQGADDECVVRADGDEGSARALVCQDFSVEQGDEIELWRAHRSAVTVPAFQFRVENGVVAKPDGEPVVAVGELEAVAVGRTGVSREGGRYLLALAGLSMSPVLLSLFIAMMR